jgi:hypothetical protein
MAQALMGYTDENIMNDWAYLWSLLAVAMHDFTSEELLFFGIP